MAQIKKADTYLAHRYLFDGYAIAVDWLSGGRGVIVAGKDQEVMGRWEYGSITQALAAWMAVQLSGEAGIPGKNE